MHIIDLCDYRRRRIIEGPSEDRQLRMRIRKYMSDLKAYHSGPWRGLSLTIDDDGKFLVRSIQEISNDEAIELLEQAAKAISLSTLDAAG